MATINDLAYAALGGPPLTLPDRWEAFAAANNLTGNDSEDAFLTANGQPRSVGTLDDRWFAYFTGSGQIAFPDMILTAGQGGARVGYRAGRYGSIVPDVTSRGDLMTDLFCNNNNGRVRFKVDGEYAPDAFTSMEIVGVGTLLAVDAAYDYDGLRTEYRWNGTGFTLVSGTVYAVDFL